MKEVASVSQSQERFACSAQSRQCLFTPARAMLRISQSLCYRVARYLFRLLRREEARWEVAAMAFLVEVSLIVSTALLSSVTTLPSWRCSCRGVHLVKNWALLCAL